MIGEFSWSYLLIFLISLIYLILPMEDLNEMFFPIESEED
jgi:hypothetical protein